MYSHQRAIAVPANFLSVLSFPYGFARDDDAAAPAISGEQLRLHRLQRGGNLG